MTFPKMNASRDLGPSKLSVCRGRGPAPRVFRASVFQAKRMKGCKVVQASSTTPKLKAIRVTGDTYSSEGFCGEFARTKRFELTGGLKGPGIIVQKVTRTFSIKDNAASNMSASSVDTYVGRAGRSTYLQTEPQYWETWLVKDGETEPDSYDTFRSVRFSDTAGNTKAGTVNKTSGWYKVEGDSTFYQYASESAAQADLTSEFTDTVNMANGLPASLSAPTMSGTATGGTVNHEVKVSWSKDKDCTESGFSGYKAPTKVDKSTITNP